MRGFGEVVLCMVEHLAQEKGRSSRFFQAVALRLPESMGGP